MTIGPMLACAIGDAYGAGFEYVHPKAVRAGNDLSTYRPHPKWSKVKGGIQPGQYTDDTQMALALAEHLLDKGLINHIQVATRFVVAFKRDHRTGYAGGFYKLLCEVPDGVALLGKLLPHSSKNGGAMRAFPLGYFDDPAIVRDRAMLQASITHATARGMAAAAAAALAFHYCYHQVGSRDELPLWLDAQLPGFDFARPWKGQVKADGVNTVRAALTALMNGRDLAHVLRLSVAFTGDVDTVAAIAMPIAAVCRDLPQNFPQKLIDGLENGPFGRDYLIEIDRKLATDFPRKTDREAQMEAAREAKRQARAAKRAAPVPAVEAEDDEDDAPGALDWLFADDDE